MKCLIVDDEPLARAGVRIHLKDYPALELVGCFNRAADAAAYLLLNPVDLIFLDIQMPGVSGIDFARSLGKTTMVIFITAHVEYALESYEVDAIDYLVKPIHPERFQRAVTKAIGYSALLTQQNLGNSIEFADPDFLFVRSERQFLKVYFKELLFIEGLKDYVILHLKDQRLMTAMNLKAIHQKLPEHLFIRVSKSYIVNTAQIKVFDNNSIYINENEIPIGNNYRSFFFETFVNNKLLNR
ncbi:LytTR family DNA-binding domain-containing protein [Pedobacter sp. MC2016-24]|uniref:LytR/AlgR family response regulator transcription factor n=1 Tax=Pedobacter sp. MC2016-24 TaxID=2780090 RepID=UPI00187ECC6D|nr:LytTR family DNA-binding domain-containing protein [Pedobacter sp. MC2016-24]MBE9600008.1 response regulator transcription factor [Pedobacter sp. MC2016-24]